MKFGMCCIGSEFIETNFYTYTWSFKCSRLQRPTLCNPLVTLWILQAHLCTINPLACPEFNVNFHQFQSSAQPLYQLQPPSLVPLSVSLFSSFALFVFFSFLSQSVATLSKLRGRNVRTRLARRKKFKRSDSFSRQNKTRNSFHNPRGNSTEI